MAQLAIVNAPSSFTTIWSFIKPWLAKETVAKVDILGTDYQEQLLELIDAENLPASLGGKCTCEGLGGCEKSNAGPWIVGREERRENWLRGEGEIALGPEDAEVIDRSASEETSQGEPPSPEPELEGGSDVESSSGSSRSSSSGYTGSDTGTHGEVLSGFTLVNGSETAKSSRDNTPPLTPDEAQEHLQNLSLEGKEGDHAETKFPGEHLDGIIVVAATS